MGDFARRKRSVEETAIGTVESEFMSAQDAASFLGVPLRSLYHYVQQGLLPSFKLGRHRLFRKHELLNTLRAMRITTSDEILR